MLRYPCVIATVLLLSQYGHCQGTLGDVALRMAPEREKLIQYVVDIRAVGNYDYTGKAKKAQEAGKQAKLVIDQHIEHSRLDQHSILAQRFKGNGENGEWFVIGESDGITFLKEGEKLTVSTAKLHPVPRDEFPCRCIDPRAIGLMSRYDLISHTSLETILGGIVGNVLGNSPVEREKDLISYKSKSLDYVFDAKHSYWPIEMRFDTGGVKLHWKTEVENVEGLDLPVRATLELDVAKDDTRKVDFVLSWQSVNKPVTIGRDAETRLRELIEKR